MPLVHDGAEAATEDVAEAEDVGLEVDATELVGLLDVTVVGVAPSAVQDVYALLRAESTATPKRPSFKCCTIPAVCTLGFVGVVVA